MSTIEPALHDRLHEAIVQARHRVLLCSPFVGGSTALDMAAIARRCATVRWELLTCLNPLAVAYGSLSVDGLRALRKAGVQVRNLDRLHAKVYLADDTVFVGSANLTASGLGNATTPNTELSVALTEPQAVEASTILAFWWSVATDVGDEELTECERDARAIPVRLVRSSSSSTPYLRRANVLLSESLDRGAWVKAMYLDAAEADELSAFDYVADPDNGRPKYKYGDLLLVYATQARICNVIFEVTGQSIYDPELAKSRGDVVARWPWMTPVRERLRVSAAQGLPLDSLGIKGQSLQSGRRQMPAGGLATALAHFTQADSSPVL